MYYKLEELRERINELDIDDQTREELIELIDRIEEEAMYSKMYRGDEDDEDLYD